MWGSRGKAAGWVRRQREWAKMWARAFAVVLVGRNKQEGGTGLGWASSNNFGGLWGIGAVPLCLVPDLWVIWEWEEWPWVWKLDKGVGWGDGQALDWLVCILYKRHTCKQVLYTIPRPGLTLRGAVSSASARSQDSKASNIETRNNDYCNKVQHMVISGAVNKAKRIRTQAHFLWSLICGTSKIVAGAKAPTGPGYLFLHDREIKE